jgi:hypothetical protein
MARRDRGDRHHNTAGVRIPELDGRTGMKAINNKWLVKHS